MEEGGFVVCTYCQSRFERRISASPPRESVIGVADDVESLLRRCRDDPANSRRLASLVLDIDPTNQEARQYCA
jgi:hypothetical protein